MTISHVKSSEDLNLLVQELEEHNDEESMGIMEESDAEEDALKKMKKTKENYRSLLVRYKEAKCEIETLNGELIEAYTQIKFLELEVVQANVKVERVSTKKLDDVLSHQKPFFDKTRLGYTGESSSVVNISKEVKFVKAKLSIGVTPTVEMTKVEKKKNVRSEAKAKFLPRSQRGPRPNHMCHHYGLQGHTQPNCYKLRVLRNASNQRSRGPRNDKRT